VSSSVILKDCAAFNVRENLKRKGRNSFQMSETVAQLHSILSHKTDVFIH